MNKKFLSAVLFGVLMASSTGTFVSCKDYDDDIDGINKELSEIKSQSKELQDTNVPVEVTIKAPNRIALKNFLFIIEKL